MQIYVLNIMNVEERTEESLNKDLQIHNFIGYVKNTRDFSHGMN